jgi:hypothetical protein
MVPKVPAGGCNGADSDFARDIVGAALASGPSKGFEAMARGRYQKPSPRREGNQWVLYYWGDDFEDGKGRRKRKRHVLGPSTMGALYASTRL